MIASAHPLSRSLAGVAGTLLLAGLCIAGATAPAAATPVTSQARISQNEHGERVALVPHADLDLGSKEGREKLEARIRIAARKVCENSGVEPWSAFQEGRCVQEAVRNGRHAAMAAASQRRGA
ncbi:UrcA family protein [Sandarakinorhabdus rubra]|uniref:UrcA family protein n=1 Tax=Sandarakinorhabdus rubra TaxID=2672568 RepID=UPI0013DA31CB|nr:UrcA family protein [Sandarakinorhabdus rubra]